MAHYKLILDETIEEDYSLLAIHCSAAPYKVAYMLNKQLGLQLHRMKEDVVFSEKEIDISFPIFFFENKDQYTQYHLVANTTKTIASQPAIAGGLFETVTDNRVVTNYLLPELRNVDFLLKIDSEFDRLPLKNSIAQIHNIKEIISVYEIPLENVHAKNHLIFD